MSMVDKNTIDELQSKLRIMCIENDSKIARYNKNISQSLLVLSMLQDMLEGGDVDNLRMIRVLNEALDSLKKCQ